MKLLTISFEEFNTGIYSAEFSRWSYDTMLTQDKDIIKDW